MLESRLLHLVARAAVRTRSPLRAKRLVDALGRLLPSLSIAEAAAVAESLEGGGTCLTRAMTVAARLPGSQVVIGSDGAPGRPFSAHAWVEHEGAIIGATAAAREVFVRL